MAGGDLLEAELARQRRNPLFVVAVAVGVHQDDGDGVDAVKLRARKFGAHRIEIERAFHCAVGAHPLVDFDDALVQHVGLDDVLGEDFRPCLVADAQRVAKALGDEQQGAVALALEQRIGGDRGAHLDRGDTLARNRFAGLEPEQVADAVHRGVPIGFGIFREQLVSEKRAVRPPADHVGKGAAAIDPEFPTAGHAHQPALDPNPLLCHSRLKRLVEDAPMHKIAISQASLDRMNTRMGKLHPFDTIDPRATALLVVDMQNYFVKPGHQGEVPLAREIVPNINRLAAELRRRGGHVVWIRNGTTDTRESWSNYHGYLQKPERAERRLKAMDIGEDGYEYWHLNDIRPEDAQITKKRYSAFIQGSSDVERHLRDRGIDTLLITGTATNVCCESSARDAMMLNFKVVMVSDGLATHTDDEHNATLSAFYGQFGDVQSVDELVQSLERGDKKKAAALATSKRPAACIPNSARPSATSDTTRRAGSGP